MLCACSGTANNGVALCRRFVARGPVRQFIASVLRHDGYSIC